MQSNIIRIVAIMRDASHSRLRRLINISTGCKVVSTCHLGSNTIY